MEEWRGVQYAPAAGTVLCKLADIPAEGGREVVLGEGEYSFRIVLVYSSGGVRAFHNRCPHVHIPLNYEPDVFHVFDGGILMCAHHGAMFRIETGECFDGPCETSRLTVIPVTVRGDSVVVT